MHCCFWVLHLQMPKQPAHHHLAQPQHQRQPQILLTSQICSLWLVHFTPSSATSNPPKLLTPSKTKPITQRKEWLSLSQKTALSRRKRNRLSRTSPTISSNLSSYFMACHISIPFLNLGTSAFRIRSRHSPVGSTVWTSQTFQGLSTLALAGLTQKWVAVCIQVTL